MVKLDTGESVYRDPSGKLRLKNGGMKQRRHFTAVDNGDVFVKLNLDGKVE